jgi:hypothetical protein
MRKFRASCARLKPAACLPASRFTLARHLCRYFGTVVERNVQPSIGPSAAGACNQITTWESALSDLELRYECYTPDEILNVFDLILGCTRRDLIPRMNDPRIDIVVLAAMRILDFSKTSGSIISNITSRMHKLISVRNQTNIADPSDVLISKPLFPSRQAVHAFSVRLFTTVLDNLPQFSLDQLVEVSGFAIVQPSGHYCLTAQHARAAFIVASTGASAGLREQLFVAVASEACQQLQRAWMSPVKNKPLSQALPSHPNYIDYSHRPPFLSPHFVCQSSTHDTTRV